MKFTLSWLKDHLETEVDAQRVADKLTSIGLEILTRAAQLGDASAILLGSAPDDAVQTLGNYGAKKVYRCADPIFDQYGVTRLWK